jgi:hypothetical protein
MNNSRATRLLVSVLLAIFMGVFFVVAVVPANSASSLAIDTSSSAYSTSLVISEVLYDPAGSEPDREWIEIYNPGCASVDLSTYKVGDEVAQGGTEGMLKFPNGAALAPGEVIIVANKATAFFSVYGFNPDYEMLESDPGVPIMDNYTAWTDGSVALHNDGDDVLLLDAGDDVVDGLSWGSSTHFFSPSAPDVSQGRSLERWPADADTDTAADWRSQSTPAPGRVALDEVFSAADCGPGSLRLHLLQADSGDMITFDPTAFPPADPVTISVQTALPSLSQDNLTLDASGAGVILDGSLAPMGTDGFVVQADNCSIQGLTIQSFAGSGISIATGTTHTLIVSNTLALNDGYGVTVATCDGNTFTANSIYGNVAGGIQSSCLAAPQITGVTIGTDETVTGTAALNARIEFFSDDEDQGRVYEGFTTADAGGVFTYTQVGGFAGPNLTATATDASGNTSQFSEPTHLAWTFLIYLNGDNDLEGSFFNTLTNTLAAGPSPRANVLALVDGYTTTSAYSGTVLYDISRGVAVPLSTTVTLTGERNMGDGQTLVDFVTWARARYPARYTMLAILDHGGGWAPGGETVEGGLARRSRWLAGGSGLSWDFTSDHDYLDSEEIRQAMDTITDGGADPLDVVFYDVCLMGMVEVAYQIQEYATYFVASQNIGWAPVGPEGTYVHRYVQIIHGLDPTATPRQVAELLVEAYADTMPLQGHPFAVAAVDLTELVTVTTAADGLALAISQTLTSTEQAALLHQVYSETQKIDYDGDLHVESDTDGFVDLYDFAERAAQHYADPNVVAASHAVTTALEATIVAERHRGGSPWMAWDPEYGLEGVVWDLDNVHGLSIFLPLGEDLELPIVITETSSVTPTLVLSRNLRLRDLYTCDELRFVCDTSWDVMIDSYYQVAASAPPTDTTAGPVDGLLPPDISAPQTVVTAAGTIDFGEAISVTWVSTDTQAGVGGATLWHLPPGGSWTAVLTQTGFSGVFVFTPSQRCENVFSVRAVDRAGNIEPLDSGTNVAAVDLQPCGCVYVPLVLRRH